MDCPCGIFLLGINNFGLLAIMDRLIMSKIQMVCMGKPNWTLDRQFDSSSYIMYFLNEYTFVQIKKNTRIVQKNNPNYIWTKILKTCKLDRSTCIQVCLRIKENLKPNTIYQEFDSYKLRNNLKECEHIYLIYFISDYLKRPNY